MKRRGSIAVVGAAETDNIGVIPDTSNMQLNAEAALNAMCDAALQPRDIDGIACGYVSPVDLASYLGIYPTWYEGTSIGGCSWINMVRHAAAAIDAGYCSTVLVVHGESGRSRVAGPYYGHVEPGSFGDQFANPYGWSGAASMFTLPVLRYMSEFKVSEEELAAVAVAQSQWAAQNPRAMKRDATTIDAVLSSPMIAYPFRRDMCCLVADGGAALVLTSADRARDFPKSPVYILGSGEAAESNVCSIAEVRDLLRPEFVRVSARQAFHSAGLTPADIDHVMIYDAFAHNPLQGLEGLGFLDYGEAAAFIAAGHTAPGGRLPLNTNGGGLRYAHTGSYGMFAMQESIRQVRGEAPAQVRGVRTSLCHGWGGFYSACATLILSNEQP